MTPKNIILTGCGGFIGFHTALQALKQKIYVFGIDVMNQSHPIFNQRLALLKKFDHFKFFNIDLRNEHHLENFFQTIPTQECIRVFHFAALTGVRDSVKNALSYLKNNIESTYHLITMMKKYKLYHLTFSSTSSVYNDSPIPYKESQTIGKPLSPYAVSKKSCEDLLYSYFKLFDLNVTILRFFTVYGPFGRPDMSIYSFIEKVLNQETIPIFGDGTQKRDFTYIDDLVYLILQTITWEGFEIINTAIGNPYSLMDMIHLIFKHTQLKTSFEFSNSKKEDMLHTLSDPSYMKIRFKNIKTTSLDQGIKKTVEWHLQQRDL